MSRADSRLPLSMGPMPSGAIMPIPQASDSPEPIPGPPTWPPREIAPLAGTGPVCHRRVDSPTEQLEVQLVFPADLVRTAAPGVPGKTPATVPAQVTGSTRPSA
ncbi:hypothetical protein Scani_27660 [Streptomyces caniferus]|uniref:Uncharacterized protein n=1 Tax=Streptomyces caniferus TaxID=285557 RepID=A0A640S603_9ACTN|nr:hypothetical protein Scani_27660 [Streptomyces caniferus]